MRTFVAGTGDRDCRGRDTFPAALQYLSKTGEDSRGLEGKGKGNASDSASTRNESRRRSNPPVWADASKVETTVDADALLEAGEVPIGRIAQSARRLSDGRVLLVTSTFPPVPLMEALEKQGFESFTRQAGPKQYETFVCRPSTGAPAGEGD